MAERIILDPSEVATGRTQLEITPWLDSAGVDWGDAEIQAYVAEQARGETPVDFRVPNRAISGGFSFTGDRGGTTTAQARANIQAKLSLFQREGGWLKRITNAGGTVYADVVNASFNATSVSGWESRASVDTDASFSLECIPDFYGDEVTLSDHTETTLPELIFTETDIAGDYPGRVRIVVDEDQAQDQRGLIWGFRSRHYDSATTAKLAYEAEALQNLDTARILALTGASGGTAVTHGTISTSWTPVVGTNVGGATYLTHTGTYRLYGRVYSTSGTTVQTRAVWDVGDLVNPVENAAKRLPGASNFYLVDYGELRLDQAPVGTHRWQGQIQAKGDVGTENFSVDRLWLVPQDEGAGVLSAPVTTPLGLSTYSAWSAFNTESGAITGDTLAIGGTWTGAGDADDFSVAAGEATRTAVSDAATGIETARVITASTPTLTTCVAQVDFKTSLIDSALGQGVALRYTGINNFAAFYAVGSSPGELWVVLRTRVASVNTVFGSVKAPGYFSANTYYTLRVMVDAAGRYFVWLGPQGGALQLVTTGSYTELATGGGIASGKPGIFDWRTTATAATRTYDNFAAWVPSSDAVMYASQSAQLTTQGHYREDSAGNAYGPLSVVTGDLPRIPPKGLESRTTQVFLKGSRGDFDQQPDTGIDDISAQVFYRPSYLFVP